MIKLSLFSRSALQLKYLCQNPMPEEDGAMRQFKENMFNKLPSFDELNKMIHSEEKKEIEV